jgi:P27 family predicted phage terminase small subunit
MGRKPKPTWLKAVTGNPGHRPLNDAEPVSQIGIGPPPEKFSDAQRFAWLEMVNSAAPGQLTVVDRSVLEMYCRARVRYDDACSKLEEFGVMIRSPVQRVPMQSPYYAIMKSESKSMQWCLVEMGFTPSSRSRVSTAQKRQGKAATPFDDLKDLPI